MPDAVSVAGIGVAYEIVSVEGGAALEDAAGKRLDLEGGEPLAAAITLWRRLAAALGPAGGGPPGTGPVLLGGFAFDPGRQPGGAWSGFPAVLLRVPALAIARVRGRTFATAQDGNWSDLETGEAPVFRTTAARRLTVEPVLDPALWKERVGAAAQRLRRGEADKVVLAREVEARGDGALVAAGVLRALRASYPSCYAYLVTGADGSALAGATPELLVRRMGRQATAQPMAGSAARGDSEEEDDRLAAGLAASAKNLAEHRVTRDAVAERLARFATEVVTPASPEVVRYTNIQHLATLIRATLPPEGAALALELAAGLHPTPAICGLPVAGARRLIGELEEMERGWYAGAVGWMDLHGDGEFAIAIRCGLLAGDSARLYAGVGVMPDSDPEDELEETELKLRALTAALVP